MIDVVVGKEAENPADRRMAVVRSQVVAFAEAFDKSGTAVWVVGVDSPFVLDIPFDKFLKNFNS